MPERMQRSGARHAQLLEQRCQDARADVAVSDRSALAVLKQPSRFAFTNMAAQHAVERLVDVHLTYAGFSLRRLGTSVPDGSPNRNHAVLQVDVGHFEAGRFAD